MIIFLAHSRVWRSYNPQNLRAISVWRAGDENYSPISLRSFCFLTAERFSKKIEHDIPHVKIFFFFKHKWWAPCVSIFGTIFNLIRVHVKYHVFEHLEMDLEKWARFQDSDVCVIIFINQKENEQTLVITIKVGRWLAIGTWKVQQINQLQWNEGSWNQTTVESQWRKEILKVSSFSSAMES